MRGLSCGNANECVNASVSSQSGARAPGVGMGLLAPMDVHKPVGVCMGSARARPMGQVSAHHDAAQMSTVRDVACVREG